MKKILFLTAIVFFSFFVVNAQPEFDLGLKAGLNNSKITNNLDEFNSETIVAWHIGAYSRIGWNRFYIQPEAYFSSKGGDLREISDHLVSSFDYTTIDVPALLGIKIVNKEKWNVRAMGGPVFSFITSGKVRGNDLFDPDYYKDNFYGWQYGVGADFLFVNLDLRIENSSNRIYSSPDLKARNNTFFITAGFRIF